MVVGVEPLFHGQGTYVPFFSLVAAGQGKVTLQVRQVQALNRGRHYVKEEGGIQNIIIVRKVVGRHFGNPVLFDDIPVLGAQVLGSSQELLS